MKGVPVMRRRLCVAWILLLSILPATAADCAKVHDYSDSILPRRYLAVGNAAWLDSFKPISTGGFVFQIATSRTGLDTTVVTDTVMGPTGPQVVTYIDSADIAPTFWIHTLLSAGASWKEGSAKFSGFAQLGLVKRTEHKVFKVFGGGIQGVLEPLGAGPIARLEIKDNLGINAGWIFYEGRSSGRPFIAVDFYKLLSETLRQ